jgi:predicted SprT family Zn-dependent metalloprotease
MDDLDRFLEAARPEEEKESSRPSRSPTFCDEMAPNQFLEATKEYAEWAIENYDVLKVDLETVTFEVSRQMLRTAGKAGMKSSTEKKYFVRFAYKAYREWGWSEEIKSTIRHELIHVRQYQETGSGDHGTHFKMMAEKADTTVNCQKFTDFKYGVFCSGCEQMVAGRHQRSKLVKKPQRYDSKCCGESCYSEKL